MRGLIVVAAVACGSPRVAVALLSNHGEAARFGRLDELAFLAGCWREDASREVITSCWSRQLEGWSGSIETKMNWSPEVNRVDLVIRDQYGRLVVYERDNGPFELSRREGDRFVFGAGPRLRAPVLSVTRRPAGRLWMAHGCVTYTFGRAQ